jgi:hypothetical protein
MSQYFDRNDHYSAALRSQMKARSILAIMYANDGSHSTARLMMRGALFTMAPYFADVCASRISEDSRF